MSVTACPGRKQKLLWHFPVVANKTSKRWKRFKKPDNRYWGTVLQVYTEYFRYIQNISLPSSILAHFSSLGLGVGWKGLTMVTWGNLHCCSRMTRLCALWWKEEVKDVARGQQPSSSRVTTMLCCAPRHPGDSLEDIYLHMSVCSSVMVWESYPWKAWLDSMGLH